LDDTIGRLQAYEKAGADVLYAPGLPDLAAVSKVCAAVTTPFNFMAGIKGNHFPFLNSPQPESSASASQHHSIERQ
jgi:2-methylisocitrate lyase-like PEP mutase family enzyme